jgi:hypothetical protein
LAKQIIHPSVGGILTQIEWEEVSHTIEADAIQPAHVDETGSYVMAALTLTGFAGFVRAAAGVLSASALIAADIPDISATYSAVAGNANLVTVGAIGTGSWHGTTIAEDHGGTGVAQAAGHTLTVAGPFSTIGHYTMALTATNNTALTLPITGTLATLAGAETLTAKISYNGLVVTADTGTITTGHWHGDVIDANKLPAVVFSCGGALYKLDAAVNLIVWYAPFACTVTNVRGYRVGGTGATINARRKGTDNHLGSALSLTNADTWMDGGAVQNTALAVGDKLEIMIVTITGSPTQVAVQVDFTRP